MTIQELYDEIKEDYGRRMCWISELAVSLGISYTEANHLTYVMGYRRGRARTLNSSTAFSMDKEVQRIHALISSKNGGRP